MKEDVLEVLLYLFDHFQDEEQALHEGMAPGEIAVAPPTEAALTEMLEQAGFAQGEILKALRWLDDLSALRDDEFPPGPLADTAMRVFTAQECERLTPECRGFLLFLEQMGVLNDFSRELTIDRVMALDSPEELDVEQLKWIVMMVLYALPGYEGAYAWVESMGDAQIAFH
ncbi:MAG: DUF494 domain-containing protein [Gammaproteobacteria bacterium]|nr:DUF494 domain-containing protein [Gammaproteobacteria bacterium]